MNQGEKPNKTLEEMRITQSLRSPINVEGLDPEIKAQYKQKLDANPLPRISWWQRVLQTPAIQKNYRSFRRFSRESLPMLVFICFSTYMLIKMENQYDLMKQKIQNSKTLKELEIEKEENYIRSVLEGRKINLDVQINEPKQEQKYKFEEEDDEENLPGFNTEDDFFESLAKDQRSGLSIPQEYEAQLKEFQQRKGV